MFHKFLLLLTGSLLAAGLSFGTARAATAAAGDAPVQGTVDAQTEQRVREALDRLAKGVHIDSISPAALPGFYQVIAAGQLVYVSADGKYMLHGDVVELDRRKNLTEAGWAAFRKAQLEKVPTAQRLVFAPAHPKYRVTVFTDVTCGYCRALHQHMAEMNRLGIEVDYLAWPREGVRTTAGSDTRTYTEMASVWCAANRQVAFTAAMGGKAPEPAKCADPVRQQFALGLKLGVDSTPTIVDADGYVVGGYLPPDELLRALQRHQAAE